MSSNQFQKTKTDHLLSSTTDGTDENLIYLGLMIFPRTFIKFVQRTTSPCFQKLKYYIEKRVFKN